MISWTRAGLPVGIWLITLCTVATADVDLEWRPATQVGVEVDATVDIGLYAVSSDGNAQGMAIIEAILLWDPTRLELVGLVNNGPYDWLSSSFPNDSGGAFDGLNAPFTGLPENDGDAWYNARSSFLGAPAMATADGLLVATFQFRALRGGEAQVEIAAAFGERTHTRVLAVDPPGVSITGTLGPPASLAILIMAPIPTVTAWGLITLTSGMLAAGSIILRRRASLRRN